MLALAVLFLWRPGTESVWAWGGAGHRTVGLIAEAMLTPQARQFLQRALPGQGLGDDELANWPDLIRGNPYFDRIYPGNNRWHYIDVDIAAPGPAVPLPADGQDVVDQVLFWQQELAQPRLSWHRRHDALAFLVHFTADMHQPLHCAFRDNDRGGNLLPVRTFRGAYCTVDAAADDTLRPNLHKTWDEYLLCEAMAGLSAEDFAATLAQEISPQQRILWQKGDPRTWAWENHLLAVSRVYRFSDDTPLPDSWQGPGVDLTLENYIHANVRVVREQLQKAGVRLAALINAACGK